MGRHGDIAMTYDSRGTMLVARQRHGAYTGCRGEFTLEPSIADYDHWRCNDCGTVIPVSSRELAAAQTPAVHPLLVGKEASVMLTVNGKTFSIRNLQLRPSATNWSGDNWIWCGGCQERGLCQIVTCTNHKDAPNGRP